MTRKELEETKRKARHARYRAERQKPRQAVSVWLDTAPNNDGIGVLPNDYTVFIGFSDGTGCAVAWDGYAYKAYTLHNEMPTKPDLTGEAARDYWLKVLDADPKGGEQ